MELQNIKNELVNILTATKKSDDITPLFKAIFDYVPSEISTINSYPCGVVLIGDGEESPDDSASNTISQPFDIYLFLKKKKEASAHENFLIEILERFLFELRKKANVDTLNGFSDVFQISWERTSFFDEGRSAGVGWLVRIIFEKNIYFSDI